MFTRKVQLVSCEMKHVPCNKLFLESSFVLGANGKGCHETAVRYYSLKVTVTSKTKCLANSTLVKRNTSNENTRFEEISKNTIIFIYLYVLNIPS